MGAMTRRRTTALVAVVAAAAIAGTVLTARSGEDGGSATAVPGASSAAASAPPVRVVLPGRPDESAAVTDSGRVRTPDGSTYNTVDATFVRMMIAHHAQAVRMSQLAAQRAGDDKVRALAQRIAAAQGPEIDRMRGWLTERRLAAADPGHDHASMPGMQPEADMVALAAAEGADFDRRFVAMMSAHHRGAVQMAGDVLTAGTDLTVNELANELAVEQTAEVRRMAQLGVG